MGRERGFLRSFGPALIIGSIVLGPGSILANSRVGADHGFSLAWLLLLAVLLMMASTALAARLGVILGTTPCTRIANDLGRPAAFLLGASAFLVVAGFQFSNNVGVLAALDPLFDLSNTTRWLILLGLNGLCVAALHGFRRLYRPLERLMKLLVALMLLGFLGNLVIVRPDLGALARGFVPSLPRGRFANVDVVPMIALVATTFSLAGAFYQAYLVRQKGWNVEDLARGRRDSITGIAVLGFLSLIVMATAARTFHGEVSSSQLGDVSRIARQLEPTFGTQAKLLFCVGILGGALSSFLGNVLVGGTMLADALGRDADLDGRAVRWTTTFALAIGFSVAGATLETGTPPVQVILTAQASTVVLNPVLASALLYLATRRAEDGRRLGSVALIAGAAIAVLVAFLLAGWKLASLLGFV